MQRLGALVPDPGSLETSLLQQLPVLKHPRHLLGLRGAKLIEISVCNEWEGAWSTRLDGDDDDFKPTGISGCEEAGEQGWGHL